MSNSKSKIYQKQVTAYAYDCPKCGKHIETLSERQTEALVASHDQTHQLKAKKVTQ